jgi:transposase
MAHFKKEMRMAWETLSMRMISEVLRLGLGHKLSLRQVATGSNLARSTVADYLGRARAAGLGWPLPPDLTEERLNALLFPPKESKERPSMPSMRYLRDEMRSPSVTLQLLWEEYRKGTPEGYGYSQFCKLYHDWLRHQEYTLRQEHKAGHKLFVDYAGDPIKITDPATGKVTPGRLFVAVLGCSNYTYAEVTASEDLADWIGAHVHAFEYMKGVAAILVPDNTKCGVTRPCRYDPDINPTYQDLAEHYGVVVIPARKGKPRDKAKVENGVLLSERWLLAALRHQTFFSIAEANQAVWALLKRLNEHPFKKLPGSRLEVFERLEKPLLKALPERRYELSEWKRGMAHIDYHVELLGHYYSVPYTLIRQEVQIRYTRTGVEIFHKGQRVAAHVRSSVRGGFTTLLEHRPPAHQKHLEWTPERIESWAAKTGPNCQAVVRRIISERRLPEQAFRPCLGVIRLGDRYGQERLEQACFRALRLGVVTYRHIEFTLKNGRDRLPLQEEEAPSVSHENIRGAGYYR